MCSKKDFTQEKVNFHATTGIPNYSSYGCCHPDDHLQEAGPPDDHLQEASPSVSSFARGRPLWMTICKRLVPSDHHLQEAGPSGWSSARGRSLWIIICKRPTTPDDHLQKAGPSGSSFVRGRPFRMTICKRPVPLDHHLQEASPPFWQPRQGGENCIFETLYNEKRCVLSVKESNINEEK